jgi:hypothetical protein
MKPVQLIKMCLNEKYSKFHVGKSLRSVRSSGKQLVCEDIADWKGLESAVVV